MAVRGVQGLIAVTALTGLAACGSVSATRVSVARVSAGTVSAGTVSAGTVSAGSVRHQSLCADGRSADRVVLSRPASPRQVTLSGTTQVRAMVAALCALPPMPKGQHCPAVSVGSVRLVFAAGEQSFSPVIVQESGCRSVTGMGATRWWSGSPSFGQMLDEAVGGMGRLVPGTHPSSVPFGP